MIEDAEPRRALARLAAVRAGGQPGTIAAITGTNGKTSTADFLRQMMDSQARAKPRASARWACVAPGHTGEPIPA